MKQHSTNYSNTLIMPAADSQATAGSAPPVKNGKATIASMQFALIAQQPFAHTSDDVLFTVYAERNDILPAERPQARLQFFSKGQPCMRTSALAKTYGWGILFDAEGKMKLIDSASDSYQQLLDNPDIHKVQAMKSKK